jgi:hypothetical protein
MSDTPTPRHRGRSTVAVLAGMLSGIVMITLSDIVLPAAGVFAPGGQPNKPLPPAGRLSRRLRRHSQLPVSAAFARPSSVALAVAGGLMSSVCCRALLGATFREMRLRLEPATAATVRKETKRRDSYAKNHSVLVV